MIFSIAFGGRTLHMDLVRQEESWQWRGVVCYKLDYPPQPWFGPRAWNDSCLQHTHQKESPEDEFGAMGFLLSCKQAYAEGVDFLYSANCIHIRSEALLLNLPRLLPTIRLASMTSLEIVVSAHWIDADKETPVLDLDHLQHILDDIATHCLSLRSFCLAFLGASDVYGQRLQILDGPALPMLDAFCRSRRLRDMRIEMPAEAWNKANTWEKLDHPHETPAKEWNKRSLWRCLDGDAPTVQYRSKERYPRPPLRLPLHKDDETKESDGYWFLRGDEGPQPIYI